MERLTALAWLALVLFSAATRVIQCQPEGPEECVETVTVADGAVLTVQDGVVCFQCDLGSGALSEASFTVDSSPVGGDMGRTVGGVLVLFDSGAVFQSPAFVACTSGGQTASAFVDLGIFQPPLISGASTVREGDSLSLDCDASNSQPLPSVAWFSPHSTQLSEDRTLSLPSISRDQAGNYSCVATNSSGATHSSSVTVTVQFSPEVTSANTGVQYFPLGATLELSCEYQAVPRPDSLIWHHNLSLLMSSDPLIRISSETGNSTLSRSALTAVDGGKYTCTATNTVGSSSADVIVRIQLPPSSPSDLAVVERSAQNLLLQWNPPAFTGFSPLGGFRVAIRELAGSLIAERILEATVTSYNVTGLQPLQEYTAEVFASNSVGLEGEPANLSAHTISLKLPPVLMVDVEVISSTQIYIQWMAPVIDPATTAEAEFYVVRYLSEGGFEGSFNVSHLNLTLEGLEKGTLYTLSVAPVNEAGEGTSNAAGPFQTAVDAPSVPQTFTGSSPTPFTLELAWVEPADTGGRPLLQYRLEISANNSVTLGPLESNAVLEDLVQNTVYMLELTAVNTDRLDSQSATVTLRTMPVGPPHVPVVRVSQVTQTTADIAWEAGGYPEHFLLRYFPSDQPNTTEPVLVVSATLTLTDLQPLTVYTVSVASHNLNGLSDFSRGLQFGTFGTVGIVGPVDCVSGGPISLTCTVERTEFSPTPLYLWSREGGTLPTLSLNDNVTGTLTLPEPSPDDSGVYVCSTGGATSRISICIEQRQESPNTVWILAVSVVAVVLISTIVSAVCVGFCVVWRKHYRQYDFKSHRKRWELEMERK